LSFRINAVILFSLWGFSKVWDWGVESEVLWDLGGLGGSVDGFEDGEWAPSPDVAVSDSGTGTESIKGPWDSTGDSIEISTWATVAGRGAWTVAV
jgi:hypothetical protein